MLQRVIRHVPCCRTLGASKVVLPLLAVVFVFTTHAFAAVPTYTGCYSASSGTINKLALGFSPQKPCNSGDIQVSFSAGDITKISVTGGLTGGGDNGDVTISLDPKYSLPQSCLENQIAKWNGSAWQCAADENTTYTNGVGLNLSGTDNAFNILPGYRLPQNCTDGSIAQVSAGNWSCATPAKGTRAYAFASGDIDLADFTNTTVATLTVPAGMYLIIGKASIVNTDSDSQNFSCTMSVDGTAVDGLSSRLGGYVQADTGIADPLPVPFLTWGTVTQTISIKCSTYKGLAGGKITAIPVTAIN